MNKMFKKNSRLILRVQWYQTIPDLEWKHTGQSYYVLRKF